VRASLATLSVASVRHGSSQLTAHPQFQRPARYGARRNPPAR